MDNINTVDLRGISHEDKQSTLFPALDRLKQGETLRVRVDFNPLPLTHMLGNREDLEMSTEMESPEEWVFRVRKAEGDDHSPGLSKHELKTLLGELKKENVSEEMKKRAKNMLQSVDAKTLGILEQELIREGISHDEIRNNLCDIHLEAMRDSLVDKRIEVEAPHPVHTLMEEHRVIVGNLHDLSALVERTQSKTDYNQMGKDVENLKVIAHHLVAAESHHQREEEALFPRVKKYDITEPPQIMEDEHVEFRQRKKALYKAAHNHDQLSFGEYKNEVLSHGVFISKELESHIFKEDNILYQIALQVLTSEDWVAVKEECDKIGYCCFAPHDQREIVELDLRPMPPARRHELIFDTWEKLNCGEVLKIINDHDPKPLYYQFQAEHHNEFNWEYLEEGPLDWKVSITKK
ncbi:hypothetical protein CHISP_3133 [Chitinispirillum alkaliphilum]|nr:hypothetical protein CHISP_3133 [Chitinispirillum alkaliphilum]